MILLELFWTRGGKKREEIPKNGCKIVLLSRAHSSTSTETAPGAMEQQSRKEHQRRRQEDVAETAHAGRAPRPEGCPAEADLSPATGTQVYVFPFRSGFLSLLDLNKLVNKNAFS